MRLHKIVKSSIERKKNVRESQEKWAVLEEDEQIVSSNADGPVNILSEKKREDESRIFKNELWMCPSQVSFSDTVTPWCLSVLN